MLLPPILWLSWHDDRAWLAAGVGSVGMWVVIALLVLLAGWRVRRAARRGDARSLRRAIDLIGLARAAVTGVLVFGLTFGGWRELVLQLLPPTRPDTPGVLAMLLALSPQIIAWLGLWAAAYPAVRAMREMHTLDLLMSDRPVMAMPSVIRYVLQQARPSLGMSLLPLLLVVAVQDLVQAVGVPQSEFWGLPLSAAIVFLVGPWLMVKLLPTAPLPPGPSRDVLQDLADRCGVSRVPVLLWQTDHTIANAAVLGLVPGLRTVLLTDLLLATMPLEQVRAVLAHEFGHIRRRHILWYGIFVITLMALLSGPLSKPVITLEQQGLGGEILSIVFGTVVIIGGILLLMRRFEREADVFAATAIVDPAMPLADESLDAPPVLHGATLDGKTFARALGNVAELNGLSRTRPTSWLRRIGHQLVHATHGTIESRQHIILHYAETPLAARRFLLANTAIRVTLLLTLLLSIGWIVLDESSQRPITASHSVVIPVFLHPPSQH